MTQINTVAWYHSCVLSVVHGPFCDLEGAFVERLRAAAARGSSVAVVAPSRRMADRLERLACVDGGLSLLGVRFHTFYSLAAALADEAGGPPGALIGDPVFHDAVVDGLLEGAGELFGGAERPKALSSAVRASLRDLNDAGVSALEVAERLGEGLVPEAERGRLKALLALALAYEKRLSELEVVSPSGLTRLAASLCESSALLGGYDEALYYGFYDLTGLQLEFFEAVCARVEATLYFPYVKGHPAFRYADSFFEQKLAARNPAAAPRAKERPAVERALDDMFSPRSPEAGTPRLELVSASGSRDEAWTAAKTILRLVDEGTAAFDEIAVIARALDPYRAAVEEVFAENAIPFELSSGEPLLRRPAAKLAWTLLSLRRRDFPASAVVDIASSPYFARRPAPRALSAWRLLLERLAIHAGWLQWRKLEPRLETGLPLDEEGRRVVPPAEVRALWEAVSSWHEELSRESSRWSELAARARALIEKELSLPKDATAAERQAYDLVLAQIDSLAAFDRLGGAASWDAFLDALERKLRSSALEPARRRGVRVLGAMDARGESFRVVIVLGLKEKSFPRQVQEDPILREPVRAALRHPAGYWIRPKRDGYEEERLLFYLTAAAAKERLVCVYPRSDESGKAEVPSLYLRELCRAAGTDLAAARRVPRLPFEKLESEALERLSPRETSLRLSAAGAAAGAYGEAVGLPGRALDDCLAALPELSRRGAAGALDGVIAPPAEFMRALRERGVSPTALDELSLCGFRFFAHRLLDLGGAEEPASQGEIAPWLRGQVYHEALERFYASLPESVWTGGAWEPALAAALEAVFAERGWRELGVYPVLWRAERWRMEEALRSFLAWDLSELRARGLRPEWRERELSGTVEGGLKVRGVVDRVDAGDGGERLRVVDYKTTWKKAKSLGKLIAEGEHHQLPLYARLAEQAAPGASVEEAAIFALEDSPEATGRPRSHSLSAKDLRTAATAFYEGLTARVEAAARGRFTISPDDGGEFGHCAYCDFPALCRKAHAPSRARAAQEDA